MRRIVVLRPEPGASETVRKARERGLDAVAIPLFEIEPLAWEPPDAAQFDGLLLTSANAVRQGGEGLKPLKSLPVYAVGSATAAAARDAGFTIARLGESGVDQLLASAEPGLHLLHLCGGHRRVPADPPQAITPVKVYRSKPRTPPPDLGEVDGAIALIHSPRIGLRLFEILGSQFNWREAVLAAISPAAAEGVRCCGAHVVVAESPNDDALLALAERLCNKPPPI